MNRRVSLTSIWEWISLWTRSGSRMSVNRCWPSSPPGFDQQIAGTDHPLEDALAETHVVDAFERDLDAVLGDQPAADR